MENENQKLKEEILDKVEDIDYNKVSPFTRDTTIQRKASEIQKDKSRTTNAKLYR